MNDPMDILNISSVNSGICIGGSWQETSGQDLLTSTNPTNNRAIADVATCSEPDFDTIIKQANKAYLHWRMIPAPQRGELVRRIGDLLRQKKDALGNLVALEMGKIKTEADGEVQEMIDMADFAVGQSRMLYGKTMHSERPLHRMYEQWHPLGIVGVITSFNFPVAVWAWNAFIAAIAGNTVVWKPSPSTPLCAIAVQKLCNQVMTEMGYSGIFSLFISDQNKLAEKFVADRRIPLISFTGSSAVGRRVNQQIARRMGRSLLELSGNNAIIVDQTADLDLAIPSIVFGAVGTAGQRCTSTRRLFVHQSLFEEVIKRLRNAYSQLRTGDPMDADTLVGPLINHEPVNAYQKAIEEIQHQKGALLYGGNVIKRCGNFVEPTLVKAENHWSVVQRETFAPILYLMSFSDLEEAITLQNQSSYGLSSALFTRDLQHAEQYLSAAGSDCGIANINIGTSGAEIGGAFGGEKDTGGGREAGSDAWKAYMRRQTNTINWGNDLPLAQGIRFDLTDRPDPG